MSTKVYTAYKLKDPTKLWKLVNDIVPRGQAGVKEELRKMYEAMVPGVDRRKKPFRTAMKVWENDYRARLSVVHRALSEQTRQAEIESQWSPFDIRVEVGVWQHKGQLYLIPYANGFCRDVMKFLAEHPLLEDFCYWNNTDEPEGMSRREWNKRGRVWDAIHDAGWQNHMVIPISCHASMYLFDPLLELERASFMAEKEAKNE